MTDGLRRRDPSARWLKHAHTASVSQRLMLSLGPAAAAGDTAVTSMDCSYIAGQSGNASALRCLESLL